MAAVTATAVDAWGFTTPSGPKKTTAGAVAKTCYVALTYAGTYAAAGNATVTSAVIAAKIASQCRNGMTQTIYSLAPVHPGDEAGATIFADQPTLSGSTWTCQLLQADNSTERADGAMGTWNSGVVFSVGYTEA